MTALIQPIEQHEPRREQALGLLRELSRHAFALYAAGEYAQAVAELDRCGEELDRQQSDPGMLELAHYHLGYTRLGFLAPILAAQDPEAFVAEAMRYGASIEPAAKTALGESERRAIRLRFLTSMDSADFRRLPAAEFEMLLGEVPAEVQDIRFWHDISLWAFRNDVSSALEQAVECALLQQSRYAKECIWLRIYLMYRVLRGDVQTLDIRHYVLSMESQPQFLEFDDNILPVLLERGHWSDELQKTLDTTRAIAASRGYQPELRD